MDQLIHRVICSSGHQVTEDSMIRDTNCYYSIPFVPSSIGETRHFVAARPGRYILRCSRVKSCIEFHMVLVAVTGPVGSGKTTVLSSFVEWGKEHLKSVDGFLAIPQDRLIAQQGAQQYFLHMIASGKTIPFARRDASLVPPYQVDPLALTELSIWAKSLSAHPPLSLLVLDEFGPMEVRGQGHMGHWEDLRNSNPEVVAIAVRDSSLRDIEQRLGINFDLVIDAPAPDALSNLQNIVLHHSDWIRIGQFGAAAGGFEATVGSALHETRLPFTGLFLSMVQSLVMMYAGDRLTEHIRLMWVPLISAGLKALAPYGGRLRPMLAITVQGFLFTIATTILGWNILGILAAGWLVGAWAALQGVILQYIIIGDNLFPAIDIVIRWAANQLHLTMPGVVTLVFVWVLICGSLSAVVTLFAWLRRHKLPARLTAMLSKGTRGVGGNFAAPTWDVAVRRGLRDLMRPLFWAPVIVVAAVIVMTGSSWEQAMWVVLRAIAVGWVLFSVARLFDPRKLLSWLRKKGHWGPAIALSRALHSQPEKSDGPSEKGPTP
jgi:nucleoside-triphosphatase THEP1